MKAFEKFAAFMFLVMLVGIVAFLTFVPMPASSEKVILMVIGALVAASTGALPRLFGSDNAKEVELEDKLAKMDDLMRAQEARHNEVVSDLKGRLEAVKSAYDEILKLLIERHVVKGEGNNGHETSI